jgi:hypothetical protein
MQVWNRLERLGSNTGRRFHFKIVAKWCALSSEAFDVIWNYMSEIVGKFLVT